MIHKIFDFMVIEVFGDHFYIHNFKPVKNGHGYITYYECVDCKKSMPLGAMMDLQKYHRRMLLNGLEPDLAPYNRASFKKVELTNDTIKGMIEMEFN